MKMLCHGFWRSHGFVCKILALESHLCDIIRNMSIAKLAKEAVKKKLKWSQNVIVTLLARIFIRRICECLENINKAKWLETRHSTICSMFYQSLDAIRNQLHENGQIFYVNETPKTIKCETYIGICTPNPRNLHTLSALSISEWTTHKHNHSQTRVHNSSGALTEWEIQINQWSAWCVLSDQINLSFTWTTESSERGILQVHQTLIKLNIREECFAHLPCSMMDVINCGRSAVCCFVCVCCCMVMRYRENGNHSRHVWAIPRFNVILFVGNESCRDSHFVANSHSKNIQ